MGQLGVAAQAQPNPGGKGFVLRCARLGTEGHQPTQDAVLRQQAIQLASHEGLEVANCAVLAKPGPLAVGAG